MGEDLFSDRMRGAQRAYRVQDWDKFKKILADSNNGKIDLLRCFDLFGNTAINIAARSDKPEILEELLGKLSEEEKRHGLRTKNNQGNTLLHEIAVFCKVVEMADIVLDLEKTTALPPVAEEDKVVLPEEEKEKRKPLVEWKNSKGETPVFKAAEFGNLKILSHLVKCSRGDMKIHLMSNRETILHASVNGQFFDVVLWIMKNIDGSSSLVGKPNLNEQLTCLQLLGRMPHAFKSHYVSQEPIITKLIYELLPDEGSSSNLLRPPVRDLETGGQDEARSPTPNYLSRTNYAFWKYLAGVFKWPIASIWKEKEKHQSAKHLADLLVSCDYSWQRHIYDESKDKEQNDKTVGPAKLPPVLYNVAKRKKELQWKEKKNINEGTNKDDDKQYTHHTPLLTAASVGITEIIDLYLQKHPESINHVSEDGQNLLHIAVKYRQEEILDRLEKQPDQLDILASRVNRENRTALHQAARMDCYRGSPLPGAAFQLQAELEWYKRVEKVVPSYLHLHCEKKVLTAGDLLDIEHDYMLKDAQEWVKQTAQSCSTVAVLVATVVFAAGYTIPGGTEGGSALHKTPVFIFFTKMDIVAFAFSLASVVMFLSILNSPCELWDFHKALPYKLRTGFLFLFLSLITTMLAFSATILITIRLQWKQLTSTLVYSAAFFPVTIFALIEFPIYMKIPRLLFKLFKKNKNFCWSIKHKG